MQLHGKIASTLLVSISLLISGCGGSSGSSSGGGSTPPSTPSTANEWTWVGGSSTANAPGVYGIEGVPAATNIPGGRYDAVSWIDGSGNFWLFGGADAVGSEFNDLWEFSPTTKTWTWMSGIYAAGNAGGIYGTLGVASTGNVPGARYYSTSWTDGSGNLWLFGGFGYVPNGTDGYLNSLWEYSPSAKTWTWVSGSNTVPQQGQSPPGVYGTQGVASVSNTPGGRDGAVSWTDSSGNLWLFGGSGYGSNGTWGELNDLWEFNPTAKTWTWVSGSSTGNAAGVYGAQGVAATGNCPGGRDSAASWIDTGGNLWLFGGEGYGSTGGMAVGLNDLWEFSPTTKTWTWMTGSSTAGSAGVYGTLGVASASNTPGGRESAARWTDTSGNFWLFGGDTNPALAQSDLWEFNPTAKTWTWVSGSSTENAVAVYGTLEPVMSFDRVHKLNFP